MYRSTKRTKDSLNRSVFWAWGSRVGLAVLLSLTVAGRNEVVAAGNAEQEALLAEAAAPATNGPLAPQAGQCLTGGCSNFDANYPSGTFSTSSTSFTTVSTVIYAGEYAYYSVASGTAYEWTLCASDGANATYDSQLSLWNQAGTTQYCYSDDYCEDDAKISWTATFTGTVRVLVSQYNCASNSNSTTLRWRVAGPPAPDLTPHQPAAWNSKIPVSVTQLAGSASHADTGPYYDNQVLYFNWASINQGDLVASGYKVHAEVTGAGGGTWDWAGITSNPTYYTYLTNDQGVGPLSAGSHTFKVWVDYDNVVAESNEANNYFERTITVQAMTPQDIRVEPASLNFDCTAAESGMATEAVAIAPAPAMKLVDAEDLIVASFDAGAAKVDVIVNLAPPRARMAATNYADLQSLVLLQQEIAQRQNAVLNALPAGDFDLRYQYENISSFSGAITQAGLNQLLADPRIESIQPVHLLEAHLAQGIPLMNATTARATHNGAGMSVAICDTGIDYTHPRLGGGGFPNTKVIGGYDFGDGDADPMDCQGHGTCCAGLAAGNLGTVGDYIGGVAYNAKLYALKMVPGCTGSATDAAMIASWDWCVTHRNDNPAYPIRVISTSFGGGRYYSACDGDSPGMTAAANAAVAAGITVLASSGNDGFCDSMGWPACISNVISVGAVYDANFGTYTPCVDAGSCATKIATGGCATGYYVSDPTAPDKVTAYSNSATFLDIFAPSNAAYTTDIVGSGGYATSDYVSTFGGTSAACPYAAGMAACLQQAAYDLTGSYLTPAALRAKLAATGDLKTDSKVAITKPRVNLGNAVASLVPCAGHVLRIYNDGTATLNVTSITKPAWVTLNPAPPYSIPGGSSTGICVTVNCGACGGSNLNGTLVINSNDPDEPVVNVGVQVTCTGLTPPSITAAVSRKTHPGAGDFNLNVLASGAVEDRQPGPTRLVVTFNGPIQQVSGTNADVTLSSGSVSSLGVASNTLTVNMSGATVGAKLTVAFPGISTSGQPAAVVTDTLCFGVLAGDANGDRATNIFDLIAIRNSLNQAVTSGNYRNDVTADGLINIFDLIATRNNLNQTVATCP